MSLSRLSNTMKILIAVIVLLALYSCVATYLLVDWNSDREIVIKSTLNFSNIYLYELADMGYRLRYLIKTEASESLIRGTLISYAYYAQALSYAALIIYINTGDKKFEVFKVAMRNLYNYLAYLAVSLDGRLYRLGIGRPPLSAPPDSGSYT